MCVKLSSKDKLIKVLREGPCGGLALLAGGAVADLAEFGLQLGQGLLQAPADAQRLGDLGQVVGDDAADLRAVDVAQGRRAAAAPSCGSPAPAASRTTPTPPGSA